MDKSPESTTREERLSRDQANLAAELHQSNAELSSCRDEISQLEQKISQMEDDAMSTQQTVNDLSK